MEDAIRSEISFSKELLQLYKGMRYHEGEKRLYTIVLKQI